MIKRNLSKEKAHGWTKTYLTFLYCLAYLPGSSLATTDPPCNTDFSDWKIPALIAIALLTSVLVPFVRYIWSIRTSNKSFKLFMKVNVQQTLDEYGQVYSLEKSIEYLDIPSMKALDRKSFNQIIDCVQNGNKDLSLNWLTYLKEKEMGVPFALLEIHRSLKKAISDAGHKKGYIPYITYTSMDPIDIDHTNPIWMLKPEDTKIISEFLISQKTVRCNLEDQYSDRIIELIKSECLIERRRWVDSCLVIMEDLARLFVHAKELEDSLKNI